MRNNCSSLKNELEKIRRENKELHAWGNRVNLQLLEVVIPPIDHIVELIDEIEKARPTRGKP